MMPMCGSQFYTSAFPCFYLNTLYMHHIYYTSYLHIHHIYTYIIFIHTYIIFIHTSYLYIHHIYTYIIFIHTSYLYIPTSYLYIHHIYTHPSQGLLRRYNDDGCCKILKQSNDICTYRTQPRCCIDTTIIVMVEMGKFSDIKTDLTQLNFVPTYIFKNIIYNIFF
jgi:hypothetical protein